MLLAAAGANRAQREAQEDPQVGEHPAKRCRMEEGGGGGEESGEDEGVPRDETDGVGVRSFTKGREE